MSDIAPPDPAVDVAVATPTPLPPMSGNEMDAKLAELDALPQKDKESLQALDDHIENVVASEVTDEVAQVLTTRESTKRTTISVIAFSLLSIALSTFGLLGVVALRGDPELTNAIIDGVGPSTIIIAAISAIAGLGSAIGLTKNE